MVDYITERGGEVHMNSPLRKIDLNEDSTVKSFTIAPLDSDEKKKVITADAYVSAMPVDLFKLIIPDQWKGINAFSKLDGLMGVPVINIHLWFDKKLTDIDHLLFSRSPLLSVYACLLYTSPSPRDRTRSRMPSSA